MKLESCYQTFRSDSQSGDGRAPHSCRLEQRGSGRSNPQTGFECGERRTRLSGGAVFWGERIADLATTSLEFWQPKDATRHGSFGRNGRHDRRRGQASTLEPWVQQPQLADALSRGMYRLGRRAGFKLSAFRAISIRVTVNAVLRKGWCQAAT